MKHALLLLAALLLLLMLDRLTATAVARHEAVQQRERWQRVLPGVDLDGIRHHHRTLQGTHVIDTLQTADGQFLQLIETLTPPGYNGPIRLRLGRLADGRLGGIDVLVHSETPGLGDRIERAEWRAGFHNRSLADPPEALWRLHQDGGAFDGLSGATLSAQAVVAGVATALQSVPQPAPEHGGAP